MSADRKNVIGLVPAAGQAHRLAPLPCSKELFPVGFGPVSGKQGVRPKVAAQYLLEQMRLAEAGRIFVVLRKGKWDIPNYFGDGFRLNLHLAYLIMRHSYGVPHTLDQAYPFIRSATIVFGFPDIVFFPKNAYVQLLDKLSGSGADIVLGIFKVPRNPEKMDMVRFDDRKQIIGIDIKPLETNLTHTWIAAAWTPVFTEFMHDIVMRDAKKREVQKKSDGSLLGELHMGDVLRIGIEAKMKTATVCFKAGRFMDIGTPEDLCSAFEFVRHTENESR